MGKRLFTEEQEAVIKKLVKGRSVKELTDTVNDLLGTRCTVDQMKALKSRRKWKSDLDATFKKNQEAWNKGMKGLQLGGEKGWFKKGGVPPKTKPVGAEVITKDGYVKVKVADPDKWELKQRLVWKEYHGEIPKGYVILFHDKNIRNFDISNLIMVSRKQLAVVNKQGLLQGDKDLNVSALKLADLIITIGEAERRMNNR